MVKPHRWEDPLLRLLSARGAAHEQAYVQHLRDAGIEVITIAGVETSEAIDATTAGMHASANHPLLPSLSRDLVMQQSAQDRLERLEEVITSSRHDIRGLLTPAALMADLLIVNAILQFNILVTQ